MFLFCTIFIEKNENFEPHSLPKINAGPREFFAPNRRRSRTERKELLFKNELWKGIKEKRINLG